MYEWIYGHRKFFTQDAHKTFIPEAYVAAKSGLSSASVSESAELLCGVFMDLGSLSSRIALPRACVQKNIDIADISHVLKSLEESH